MREGAGHRDEQAGEGRHERGEGAGAGDAGEDRAEQRVVAAGEQRGQFEHDLVRALGADGVVELGRERAADDAVDGREDVEDADEDHHPHRGALGGDAVGVRVEADEDVRQAGGAADERDDQRVGVEERVGLLVRLERGLLLRGGGRGDGGVDGLGGELAERGDPSLVLRSLGRERLALDARHRGHGGLLGGLVGGEVLLVLADDRGEDEDREGDGEDLEPILEGLDQRDALHAAERDVEGDDRAHDHDAGPIRQAGEDVSERGARALHLGHGVEEADEEHEADRDLAEHRRIIAALGEVRDGVGAEAAQRARDEEQQEEVTARVADGIPERVVTGGHHHAGHAHEGRGGEVFARDGGGVPADGDRAARDEEVAGALGLAGGPEAHADGDDDGDERAEGDPGIDAGGGEEGVHVTWSGRPGRLWLRRLRARWSA